MASYRAAFWPNGAMYIRHLAGGGLAGAAMLLLSTGQPQPAMAQMDHSGLTRESYRRKCLLCHSRAAPEGVAPAILAGLHPEPGLRPADAMPGILCWRRCKTCWGPEPAAKGDRP